MKRYYIDYQGINGIPFSMVFGNRFDTPGMEPFEVLGAGTTVFLSPAADRDNNLAFQLESADIHLIFDDCAPMPSPAFYAVPQVDVFATDGMGGYWGTVGGISDADEESTAPICHISHNRTVIRVADNLRTLVDKVAAGADWRKGLQPLPDICLYASYGDAAQFVEFIKVSEKMRQPEIRQPS